MWWVTKTVSLMDVMADDNCQPDKVWNHLGDDITEHASERR